jgi:ammonia channel protein AmtB
LLEKALLNTNAASASGMLAWLFVDRIRGLKVRHPHVIA